jgi:probable biosynthetic protein (TIGR04098 family)
MKTKERVIKVLKRVQKNFNNNKINSPINNIGIDSMGFVEVRVEIDQAFGINISDKIWYRFNTIGDLITHIDKNTKRNISLEPKKPIKEPIFIEDYEINLPQMANNVLSENWLFKELGNSHWKLLTEGISTKSSEIKDENGNRLYATFARIRIDTVPLNKFKENDNFQINGKIVRYGQNNYTSKFISDKKSHLIEADLMTIFSKRNNDGNIDLIKSNPKTEKNNIKEIETSPDLLEAYRLVKKRLIDNHILNDEKISLQENDIFSVEYKINPYYDLNGVGLLYFAAYPTIVDFCESKYFNTSKKVKTRWENEYFTISKDIFYYGNSNIDDVLLLKINNYQFFNKNKVKIYSSLFRKSDNRLIADIFTIKKYYQAKL